MQEHNSYSPNDELKREVTESGSVAEHLKNNTRQLGMYVEQAIKQYQPEVDVVQFSTEAAVINLLINQLLEKYYELESKYRLSGLVLQQREDVPINIITELDKQSEILNDYYSRLVMPLKSQLIRLERAR